MEIPSAKPTILLPLDFSPFTPAAIAHACNYAQTLETTITLVHFLDKSLIGKENEIAIEREKAISKLENFAEGIFAEHGIKCYATVRVGDFHAGIGDLANEVKAGLVVMATKGIHGMQRWTGSNAIKVILHGKQIPFVVVQDLPKNDKPEQVILPFSFEVESRQKLGRVPELAKLFDCVFHIVSEPAGDEFIRHKIENNVMYAKRFLEDHDCKYTASHTPKKKAFHKELIDFAAAKSADLILIMSEEDHDFLEIFTGSHEQEIIANEAKIPVMVLNAKETMRLNGAPMFF
ncbi:MAG: universal stress protein [Bacteroidia bacterium]